ncbi:MAG: alpha/beta hydrolase [Enterobacterales bacterium]|nr:alpha/beta hydrolase [Enterobacterales bacterium]
MTMLVACEQQRFESTATENVVLLEQELTMNELQRTRQVRLYLPPGYKDSEQHYPVLYMHDAQNLFDTQTAYAGEWQVDEALNTLHAEKGVAVIVVGIDNGGDKRINELSPWQNDDYGQAEGEAYVRFIVEQLKPYIDEHYKTKPDAANTGVMGSSLGGLITQYAIFEYPNVFSKAGVYSPSFWFSDAVYEHASEKLSKLSSEHKIHYLVGTEEGSDSVADINKMVSIISEATASQAVNQPVLLVNIVPGGEHNESFWAQHFAMTIEFLYH